LGQKNTKNIHSSKKDSQIPAKLGIAWYRREEWSHLLEISADRDELEDTHEEWLHNAEIRLHEMAEKGINAVRVHINVDELHDWCIVQGRPLDGSPVLFSPLRSFVNPTKGRKRDGIGRVKNRLPWQWAGWLRKLVQGGFSHGVFPRIRRSSKRLSISTNFVFRTLA
jgi:hypothetical protein